MGYLSNQNLGYGSPSFEICADGTMMMYNLEGADGFGHGGDGEYGSGVASGDGDDGGGNGDVGTS